MKRLVVLDTLLPLASNSRLVREANEAGMRSSADRCTLLVGGGCRRLRPEGAVVYLLDQWCNGSEQTLRERAGELLAKMAADKLHGPAVRATVGRFLPTVFLDTMRQGPKEALHLFQGAVVYLLDQWCNGSEQTLRERAGELLAKMAADKLHGPAVRATVGRFLPTVFLDTMRQGPKEALHLFQAQQENPELVWKEETRQRLCQAVRRMALE
ncbi:hypothetical protein HPB48_012885 [Haemaphysalis longicornis]|uniref:Uncharacterized protein n=1 Tax=Haemaphysalis longicornis TaxID=44386 RepID=A0A9J6H683_HAELO|nr:hypothetical protein HPB48_012885 [Haemaphysalis longicornis]